MFFLQIRICICYAQSKTPIVLTVTHECNSISNRLTVCPQIRQSAFTSGVLSLAAQLRILRTTNILHRYSIYLAKRYATCFSPMWKSKLKSRLSVRSVHDETN